MSRSSSHRSALSLAANPRVQSVEIYDPGEEQIRAMIQGVYESRMEQKYGVPFYDEKGARLDAKLELSADQIKPVLVSAFRIGKGNARKFGYAETRNRRVVPTMRAVVESADRYHQYDTLLENRQSYEETLGLARHDGFFRVTAEPAGEQLKFFVWPLLKGHVAPRPFDSREAALRERDRRNVESDPRMTGRWWRMPENRIKKTDLRQWLPNEQFWRLR